MSINFKSDNLTKHRPLADAIKSSLEVDGAQIKEKESHGAYYANLPEGLEKKQVEEMYKYNTRFVTASHLALGETAADIFKENKNIQEVSAQIGFFGKSDTIDSTISRSKVYQNHLAEKEEDKEVTKHLVIKTTINAQSVKGYGLKSIRESMSTEFEDMFKK